MCLPTLGPKLPEGRDGISSTACRQDLERAGSQQVLRERPQKA